jgi:hypothetical protein
VIASFGALLDRLTLSHGFDPVGFADEEIHRKIEHEIRERSKARHKLQDALVPGRSK